MSVFPDLPEDWRRFLNVEKHFGSLSHQVDELYSTQGDSVFPPREHVFRAFELCPVEQVRVLILGQDPYHVRGQANGLAFSCDTAGVLQPSLSNILQEVERSTGQAITNRRVERGDLTPWAEQGVLLLNTVLTVDEGRAGSHRGQVGWEAFTRQVVYELLSKKQHLVFLRWGRDAEDVPLPPGARQKHCLLTASHPSPLSCHRSFKGCDHFAECNRYLTRHGLTPIEWTA